MPPSNKTCRVLRSRLVNALSAERDWPSVAAAVKELLKASVNPTSDGTKIYKATKTAGKVAHGRTWEWVEELPSDEEWYPVPAHVLPANTKNASGWRVSKSGKAKSPSGSILGTVKPGRATEIEIVREKGGKPAPVRNARFIYFAFNPDADQSLRITHINGDISDDRLENLRLDAHSDVEQKLGL